MFWRNFKMALSSLRYTKLRSFLTMLGIIIGVSSVVNVIAVGEGVKQQISQQVTSFGADLIQVNPGKSFSTDEQGQSSGFNFAASLGVSTLTEQDVKTIKEVPNVNLVAPAMIISGIPTADDKKAESAFILATTSGMGKILEQNQPIEQGNFLTDTNNQEVVIGKSVAKTLFGEENPLGKTITVRNQTFNVIGVLKKADDQGLSMGPDISNVIYIPFESGKIFSGGIANIIEIDLKVSNVEQIKVTQQAIRERLKVNHGGEEDFTVSTPEEQLKIIDQILDIMTSFIAAIASISLLVGGIGIMNIMLVSVTERTREIGIRKAIGASNRNILSQFLIEAIVLTLTGGLIGVLVSLIMSVVIKQAAHITPVFTANAFIIAISISTGIGIIFGLMPAIKAARKNPIEALRYE